MSKPVESPGLRRRTMQAVRSKDTKPEMVVRRLVHSLGYRYRLHRRDLPGVPDLVFPSRRKIIFVHGCFWHGHPCRGEPRLPKTNREYWVPKIARNAERDRNHLSDLDRLGWDVLTIWECELKDKGGLESRLRRFLDSDGHPQPATPLRSRVGAGSSGRLTARYTRNNGRSGDSGLGPSV